MSKNHISSPVRSPLGSPSGSPVRPKAHLSTNTTDKTSIAVKGKTTCIFSHPLIGTNCAYKTENFFCPSHVTSRSALIFLRRLKEGRFKFSELSEDNLKEKLREVQETMPPAPKRQPGAPKRKPYIPKGQNERRVQIR